MPITLEVNVADVIEIRVGRFEINWAGNCG